jgi:hypothetical protein
VGESEEVRPESFSKSRSRGRLRLVVVLAVVIGPAVGTAGGPEEGGRGGESVEDEEDNGWLRLLRSPLPTPTPLPESDVTDIDIDIAAAIEALSYGCGRAVTFVLVGEVDMEEEAERDMA